MTPLTRRSALAHRVSLSAPDGAAAIAERAHEGKLILRGKLDTISLLAASVAGAPLPGKAGATAMSSRGLLQWLGPDEWLLVTPPGGEASLIADLTKALAGQHAQLVDVTDYYTTIALSGTRAREMLMKITTVDFHPRAFKPGMGVTTNFGRTVAWGRQTGDESFDLIVRISMADYLWCLLAEAGREWGLREQKPKGADAKLHLPHFELAPASSATDSETAMDLDIS